MYKWMQNSPAEWTDLLHVKYWYHTILTTEAEYDFLFLTLLMEKKT
jgi:hypothetical protein